MVAARVTQMVNLTDLAHKDNLVLYLLINIQYFWLQSGPRPVELHYPQWNQQLKTASQHNSNTGKKRSKKGSIKLSIININIYIHGETIIMYCSKDCMKYIWGSILQFLHRTDRVWSRNQFPVESLDTAVNACFICQLHKTVSCWAAAQGETNGKDT